MIVNGSDLLTGLNEQQQAAVIHGDGPALVLAGAGSGKTRVLTHRVAWLIQERGMRPDQIMLLTFTNKAAAEMQQRVMALTGARLPYAGTFHSVCARLLRQHAAEIGLSPNYIIYDTDDQLALLKLIAREYSLEDKRYHPRVLLKMISEAKQQLLSPAEYKEFSRGEFQQRVANVYTVYEQRLRESGAVDFDNLLMNVVELLRSSADVRQYYQKLWQHVLIDEYQDTNAAQYALTNLFTFPNNNLFVVGDASQAIYGWRGADYRNLVKLRSDYSGLEEYRLERNYRSTSAIVEAASQVIRNNTRHPVLELWTDREDDRKIELIVARDGGDEAAQIARKIQDDHGDELDDVAILYRTNAQSREFEEALLRAGLPYKLVGGVAFYSRKEIKDLIAYLAVFLQPNDQISTQRALKLGKRRFGLFQQWANEVQPKHEAQPIPTAEILEQILTVTSYKDRFDKEDPTDLARLENIQELQAVALQFPDIQEFLAQLALVGGERVKETADEGPAVTLMSLHAAKGLEFETVFLTGLEEGLFPHSRSLQDAEQMEEERRLCYVGITRARQQLYISYAQRRLLYGGYTSQLPARFLQEISPSLVHSDSSLAPAARPLAVDPNDPELDALLHDDMSIQEWLAR